MEVLIAVAIYSTLENKKDECLYKMLCSLRETVDFKTHKLGLSINSFTGKTLDILKEFDEIITYKIFNDETDGCIFSTTSLHFFNSLAVKFLLILNKFNISTNE